MTDINDLVQEFWMTSSDGAIGSSIFAICRLFEILQDCSEKFKVCLDIISVLGTAVGLADKILQKTNSVQGDLDDKFEILFDQSLSKSKELGDLLSFLPGVAVQEFMNKQGMADLYRIKPDLLKRLLDFTFDPGTSSNLDYKLDDGVSGFLQDRDRSQLYYCDPIFLFAVISCLSWMDPMPLTLSRRFPA